MQIVNGSDAAYEHLSQEERALVRDKCNDADAWLTAQQAKQEALKLNQDPVLVASAVDERTTKLRDACRPVVDKPKPKPPAPSKTDAPKPSDTPKPESTPTPPPTSNGSAAGEAKEEKKAGKDGAKGDVVDEDMGLD